MSIPYRHSALSSVQPLNLVASSMSICRHSDVFLTGGVAPHDIFPILSSDVKKLASGIDVNSYRLEGELIAISITHQPLPNTIPTNSKSSTTQDPKSYASKPSTLSTTPTSFSVSTKDKIFESKLVWYTLDPKFKNLNITFVVFDSFHHSPSFSEPVIIRECFTNEKITEIWGDSFNEDKDLEQFELLSSNSFKRIKSWLKRFSLSCCTLVGGIKIALIVLRTVFNDKNKGKLLHKLHSHSS